MQKYNKNSLDLSKMKDAVPDSHLYDKYRNRNLYQLNLPIKDHSYNMPKHGVQELELRKTNEESPHRENRIVKPNHATNIRMNTQSNSEFVPTYGTIFNAKSSAIDPQLK